MWFRPLKHNFYCIFYDRNETLFSPYDLRGFCGFSTTFISIDKKPAVGWEEEGGTVTGEYGRHRETGETNCWYDRWGLGTPWKHRRAETAEGGRGNLPNGGSWKPDLFSTPESGDRGNKGTGETRKPAESGDRGNLPGGRSKFLRSPVLAKSGGRGNYFFGISGFFAVG